MTQEDKELLLKDLSARLPYWVMVLNTSEGANEVCVLDSVLTSIKYKENLFVGLTTPDDSMMTGIEMVKPYLRSMDSMTEEEKEEYEMLQTYPGFKTNHTDLTDMYDWLNAHHFDYRGLIEKGLALEAKEGMYNKK